MKITKSQLKQIIKEELGRVLNEEQEFLNQNEFEKKDAGRGRGGSLDRTIVVILLGLGPVSGEGPRKKVTDAEVASVRAKLASLSGLVGEFGALGHFGGGTFAIMVPGPSDAERRAPARLDGPRYRTRGEIKNRVESALKELNFNIEVGVAFGEGSVDDLLRSAESQIWSDRYNRKHYGNNK